MALEFKLRQGVTFHNGEPFDADDVVYTFNFISNPDNKILNQRNVKWIKNAEKIDQWTVRINLKAPFPPAIDFIAGSLPIYPNEYYAKVGPKGMNLKPSIKTLNWRTIPDGNTQMAELMAGGADWLWKADPDQAKLLGSNPTLTVKGGGTMRIGFLQIDAAGTSGDHPIKNVLVRRAMSHAINRLNIVDNLLPEGSEVVNPACYPTQVGCTKDVPSYAYDVAKATSSSVPIRQVPTG